ncbi:hypothetical protein [Synechococcus sp. CCY 9618]|uniref:hypothetical protein n=1 Tax=Synechococcus sp. CCY 9618 TaxID=2815602 RepID=UPI001C21309A|nr:hypothetical protein [Synechococcus sp. CCY 9618]
MAVPILLELLFRVEDRPLRAAVARAGSSLLGLCLLLLARAIPNYPLFHDFAFARDGADSLMMCSSPSPSCWSRRLEEGSVDGLAMISLRVLAALDWWSRGPDWVLIPLVGAGDFIFHASLTRCSAPLISLALLSLTLLTFLHPLRRLPGVVRKTVER